MDDDKIMMVEDSQDLPPGTLTVLPEELHRRGLVRRMAKVIFRILLRADLIQYYRIIGGKPGVAITVHTGVEPLERDGLTASHIWAPIWAVALARWFHLQEHLSKEEAADRIIELKGDPAGIRSMLVLVGHSPNKFCRDLARMALERSETWDPYPTALGEDPPPGG